MDDAEEREGEAFLVNAVGPATLAAAAREAGALLVTVSTDYVFDGVGHDAVRDRPPDATGVGLRADQGGGGVGGARGVGANHLILRTAWLYGAQGRLLPEDHRAGRPRSAGSVSVVADQHGQPTWTRDVADLAERLVVGRGDRAPTTPPPAGRRPGSASPRRPVAQRGCRRGP